MQFRNSTDFSDRFIRRMLSWCLRECEVPARPGTGGRGKLREVRFTNCRRHYRGRAGSGRVLVRIGPPSLSWPVNVAWAPKYRAEGMTEFLLDRIATLVHVTCHELGHIRLERVSPLKNTEANADAIGRGATHAFLRDRDRLLADWSSLPETPAAVAAEAVVVELAAARKAVRSTVDLKARRAAKAAAMLAQWQRRAKIAAGKVKKYARRVRYYERQAAEADLVRAATVERMAATGPE